MVLDTFRWFMSTVAQTLGAVSAIILAAYIMWMQRMRGIKENTISKAKEWRASTAQYGNWNHAKAIMKYFECKNLDEFVEETITSKAKEEGLQHSLGNSRLSEHNRVYKLLFDYHDKYQDASKEIQKSQQLWIPLLLSFITIIGSLAAMMFDGCIVYTWYWGWILTSAVMLFAATALGWYFVFLYRVISPRSKRDREKQA